MNSITGIPKPLKGGQVDYYINSDGKKVFKKSFPCHCCKRNVDCVQTRFCGHTECIPCFKDETVCCPEYAKFVH